jgi:hypothetical protein
MSPVLEVCAIIVTVAIAVIAIMTIRAMHRFESAAIEFKRTARMVRASVAEAETVTRQVQELAGSIETVVSPLKRAAHRVEELSDRAVGLSNVVLNEVEGPIRNTLALITGVRTGTRSLMGALTRRAGRESNGGYSNVDE